MSESFDFSGDGRGQLNKVQKASIGRVIIMIIVLGLVLVAGIFVIQQLKKDDTESQEAMNIDKCSQCLHDSGSTRCLKECTALVR